MSLTGLKAFHLVAQAGSFTKAARAGHVSQPTISAQVRALEDARGARLFDRHGRTVSLTPLGHRLVEITTRLFSAEEEADALLSGARTLVTGHLRIAADSASHAMPLLAELKRRHGGLTFSLSMGNSSEVVSQVLDYAADIGVTAKQTSDPRIHRIHLRDDRLVVFVPLAHPWSRRRTVRMRDLAGQDLVTRERGSITREVFETRLAEAGIRPGALVEVQSREAVREAVRRHLRQRVRAGCRLPQAGGAGRRPRRRRVRDLPRGTPPDPARSRLPRPSAERAKRPSSQQPEPAPIGQREHQAGKRQEDEAEAGLARLLVREQPLLRGVIADRIAHRLARDEPQRER